MPTNILHTPSFRRLARQPGPASHTLDRFPVFDFIHAPNAIFNSFITLPYIAPLLTFPLNTTLARSIPVIHSETCDMSLSQRSSAGCVLCTHSVTHERLSEAGGGGEKHSPPGRVVVRVQLYKQRLRMCAVLTDHPNRSPPRGYISAVQ